MAAKSFLLLAFADPHLPVWPIHCNFAALQRENLK
jgi:hypothetical protein